MVFALITRPLKPVWPPHRHVLASSQLNAPDVVIAWQQLSPPNCQSAAAQFRRSVDCNVACFDSETFAEHSFAAADTSSHDEQSAFAPVSNTNSNAQARASSPGVDRRVGLVLVICHLDASMPRTRTRNRTTGLSPLCLCRRPVNASRPSTEYNFGITLTITMGGGSA